MSTSSSVGARRALADYHNILRRLRPWRIGAIVVAGAITVALTASLPLFREHPFALLYAYVLFAAWYGDLWEGAGGIALAIVGTVVLLLRSRTLLVEESIFAVASLFLLALVQNLRRAQQAAQMAQRQAEAARAMAEEMLHRRDHVVSTISHDLKNPLGAIKGSAQLMQRRLRKGEPVSGERMSEELSRIDAAATRMARLLNEMVDAAQLQAGQPLALQSQPTDLVALCRGVVAEYAGATQRHHLEVVAAEPVVVVVGDAFRLERVLSNLLMNAVKYSPDRGDIIVGVAREENRAVLTVRDEGIGIPAADLPRIFEPFHRAGNVGRIVGTGLGLAGSRQIVAQHGGDMTVESTLGRGTTVTVSLPWQASYEEAAGDIVGDIVPTTDVQTLAHGQDPLTVR